MAWFIHEKDMEELVNSLLGFWLFVTDETEKSWRKAEEEEEKSWRRAGEGIKRKQETELETPDRLSLSLRVAPS